MNKNSFFYWYPKIRNQVPTPKTEMFIIPPDQLMKLINTPEDHETFLEKWGDVLREKANLIGYPLFMRTDQMACKHSWKNTCYVATEEDLFRNMFRLVDENFAVDMFGEAEPNGLVFREFLNLEYKFKAFEDTPISTEWRFFIRDGAVECIHPYWPPASIRRPSRRDWLKILKKQSEIGSTDKGILTKYSKAIGEVLDGYWSVDFCKTKMGVLYLTDMAAGERSYHWPT